MKIKGSNGTYDIGDIIADNSDVRTRRCSNTAGRELMCQIAVDASKNAALARNALVLTQLAEASDKVEAEYARHQEEAGIPAVPLNYNIAFPELVDSFILLEQGARQINILGFRNVDELSRVSPLVKLWKGDLRVDLRTSAWIMGKLLKTIAFAHNNGISVVDISGNNVLIEPDQHYVFVFNWARSIIHDDGAVPSRTIRDEIKRSAKLVIKALGDDLDRACPNEVDLPYVRYLYHLATNGESSAFKAHKTFYEVVDSLCENPDSEWERGFYKFTTLPL